MNPKEVVEARNITEIVHYTSEEGLAGILASRELKCKKLLREDQYLEHILKINTQRELDADWNGYVHLSITRINSMLFGCSAGSWHKNVKWRILAFDPEILSMDGVQFVTTNNAYSWHLKRDKGGPALERLFSETVAGRYGKPISRIPGIAANLTTDEQAEVLFPRAVPIEYLRTIYVANDADQNAVAGQLYPFKHKKIAVEVAPEKFVF